MSLRTFDEEYTLPVSRSKIWMRHRIPSKEETISPRMLSALDAETRGSETRGSEEERPETVARHQGLHTASPSTAEKKKIQGHTPIHSTQMWRVSLPTIASSGRSSPSSSLLLSACAYLLLLLVLSDLYRWMRRRASELRPLLDGPSSTSFRAHLVGDATDEAIVAPSRLEGQGSCLFQIDTGYAGPPVLSVGYLSHEKGLLESHSDQRGVEAAYRSSCASVRSLSAAAERSAVESHVRASACQSYTSGCGMRLMGIGSVEDKRTDLLLCPNLVFRAEGGRRERGGHYASPKPGDKGDVLVTNNLPGAVHVLTSDYLFQVSPCCIRPADGVVETHLTMVRVTMLMASFASERLHLSGGSPLVRIRIGSEDLWCTLDTGAPGPVCLGRSSLDRVASRCTPTGRTTRQVGTNNETVCSSVLSADVTVHGVPLRGIAILANDADVANADGYVGLGVLRGFDVLLTHSKLGLRRNALRVRSADEYGEVGPPCR